MAIDWPEQETETIIRICGVWGEAPEYDDMPSLWVPRVAAAMEAMEREIERLRREYLKMANRGATL